MTDPIKTSQLLALLTSRLLISTARAVEDLTSDELHFRAHADSNSIGFEAWHVAKTADDIIHYGFAQVQSVWSHQNLEQVWKFPRIDQGPGGTGMDHESAHGLRFPNSRSMATYIHDVTTAIEPQIEAMDDDYLQTLTTIPPWGERARIRWIGQLIITHGHSHLGQINLTRTLQGKDGLGF